MMPSAITPFHCMAEDPAVGWLQVVLPGQRLLEHADQQEAILRYVPCEDTRAAVRAEWDRRRPDLTDDINLDRWAALKRVCEAVSGVAAVVVFCACS